MPLVSAGLLMHRARGGALEVFLAHPGGPIFRDRDDGWWTIPKGLVEPGESLLEAAVREFREEIGMEVVGPFVELGWVRQKGGKVVHAWAFAGDRPDDAPLPPCTFRMQWPYGSGRWITVPEIDRTAFFPLDQAAAKINEAQRAFLDRLEAAIRLGATV